MLNKYTSNKIYNRYLSIYLFVYNKFIIISPKFADLIISKDS